MNFRTTAATVWAPVVATAGILTTLAIIGLAFQVMGFGFALAFVLAEKVVWFLLPLCGVWVIRPLFVRPRGPKASVTAEIAFRFAASFLISAMVGDAVGLISSTDMLVLTGISGALMLALLTIMKGVEWWRKNREAGG